MNVPTCLYMFVLILFTDYVIVNAAPQLIQLQVITRHGARTVLNKEAATLAEGGSSLTTKGEAQLTNIGGEIRMEYMTQNDRLKNLKIYEPNKVWIQSSNFDRTISSSMSLVEGIWPETNGNMIYPNNVSKQIPVHSAGCGPNDVTIRAYANCPAFHTRLDKLYSSDEFTKKENSYINFLKDLKTLFPTLVEGKKDEPVSLKDLWNIFDIVNVAKDLEPNSIIATTLTTDQFNTLKELTAWVEHKRFSADVAGMLIGSNLWQEVFQRMESLYLFDISAMERNATFENIFAMNKLPEGALHPPHQFIHYSAHYPTILGLFSSLQLFEKNSFLNYGSNKDFSAIPNYGATLIIELWKKDASIDTTKVVEEQMYIRARYKDGDSVTTNASPYIDLGTECEINSKNLEFPTKSCPLSTFKNMLTKQTFTSLYAWCNACDNYASQICLKEYVKQKTNACPSLLSTTSLSGLGGLIVGGIMGIFFSFACVYTGFCNGVAKKCCKKRRGENYQRHRSTTELPSTSTTNQNSL